ncbi:hypothetical protein D0X99_12305 [Algoriphagus lacus]|uniref:Uncharacterized protein n=1 Tax=Algoriphagus lacus TaxID=2056311 RepID=A0A418PRI7_9BACT|nr:hypothetical protein [Algoriphagus lacus]RIW15216.1 hypothetical protein D0X99_12305 [Algoriphagus lacus]
MKEQLQTLREKINSGQFPTHFPHFGGANLIITDNPNRSFHEGDVVIYTAHASAMSWLVMELKEIYGGHLNSLSKYRFYPEIGKLIQESLRTDYDVFESMEYVIEEIEKSWGAE